jgi:hypothetical protein
MSIKTDIVSFTAVLLLATTLSLSMPAHAGNAGAFIGGMLTAKVVNNMSRRTEAEEQQAANSSRQAAPAAAAPAPAPAPAAQTPEQRIAQLDKLAAGGYITPAEYKAKKKSIIDGM